VPLRAHVALLDPLRELDLLIGGEKLDPADRPQVQAQRVEAWLDGEVELLLSLPRFGLRLPIGVTPLADSTSIPCSIR